MTLPQPRDALLGCLFDGYDRNGDNVEKEGKPQVNPSKPHKSNESSGCGNLYDNVIYSCAYLSFPAVFRKLRLQTWL
jgi:hypothetical protein